MTKLEELKNFLLENVQHYIDIENIYDKLKISDSSNRVICCITEAYRGGFNIHYFTPYRFDDWVNTVLRVDNRIACSSINERINRYNKEKEVKNMANRCFIVEKMEVEQRCGEPDVINMTVRQEPDGIPFQTGRDLRTLIESLDPDKLSSDSRIAVDISNDTVDKTIYMMTARGTGKTRWASELLKNKTVVYNGNIHTNIENVIFNDPATIVFWIDGSKTVVKCQKGETFDPEKGLAMAISKKVLGNDYGYYETFAKHVGRYNKKHKEKPTLTDFC